MRLGVAAPHPRSPAGQSARCSPHRPSTPQEASWAPEAWDLREGRASDRLQCSTFRGAGPVATESIFSAFSVRGPSEPARGRGQEVTCFENKLRKKILESCKDSKKEDRPCPAGWQPGQGGGAR